MQGCLSSVAGAAQALIAASKAADVEEFGLQDGDIASWRAEDAALARLPEALVSAFTRTEQDFYTHSKVTRAEHLLCQLAPQRVPGTTSDVLEWSVRVPDPDRPCTC